MRVALRVEVRTLRGLREGVPNLMRLFSTFQVRASFFFPLGRDLSGRAPWQTWRDRRRTGLKAMAFGTLLPAPLLQHDAVSLIRTARQNGHDVGVLGGSPVDWLRNLANAKTDWIHDQCQQVWDVLDEAGVELPIAWATPGWQVNPALLEALSVQRVGYTSLTRGKLPYLPMLQGVRGTVPEIPTTLPTIDELLEQPDVSVTNVHEYLYAESRHVLPAGHVFTAHAEREGQDRLGLMEKLLVMWKGQDGSVRSLDDLLKDIDPGTLPRHQIGWGSVDGDRLPMAMQSIEVPA